MNVQFKMGTKNLYLKLKAPIAPGAGLAMFSLTTFYFELFSANLIPQKETEESKLLQHIHLPQ